MSRRRRPTPEADDLIGIAEIAELLDVTRGTVQLWNSKARGILPPSAQRVSNIPLWRYGDIVDWAQATGRWGRRRVNRFDVP